MGYDTGAGRSQWLEWLDTAPRGSTAGATSPPNLNLGNHGSKLNEPVGEQISAISPRDMEVPRLVKKPGPPITTDRAVRSRLQTPRGKLFVFTGKGDIKKKDELLLMSPAWKCHTDCRMGPTPKVYALTQFCGDAQTFMVRFEIETFVNEVEAKTDRGDLDNPDLGIFGGIVRSQANRALLSNRFQMKHTIDADSYLTMETVGEAHFRADLLYIQPPLSPDDLRLNLFLPVPVGCIRGNIEIETHPDGTGVSYSFVDRQQRTNFVAGHYAGATEIQAVHRQSIAIDDDLLTGALTSYERVLNVRSQRAFAYGQQEDAARLKQNKADKKAAKANKYRMPPMGGP